jgi:oxygen-independent coproporphyrinogen-3 oxidase
MAALAPSFLRHAARALPRYTSYPTALAFQPAPNDLDVRSALAGIAPEAALSVYVHIPFCERLCWYCGCATTAANGYRRIAAYHARLLQEIALWAKALGPHAGVRHLHFGGGSPNALAPEHFLEIVAAIKAAFTIRTDAEIAVELDPATLSAEFVAALGKAGVTRASLGVQTFDPAVQAKINRVQPFEVVARAAERLRAEGVGGLNIDLMYALPGQTPESVAATVKTALALKPDRAAVFGYAHVPWARKHQTMIAEHDLADAAGRWRQADAADEAFLAGGYRAVGLDHFALAGDALAIAAGSGRLRRNFQGYTDDPAPVLLPLGATAIGQTPTLFFQNAVRTDHWAQAIAANRLPIAKILALSPDDRLRGAVIERLMCDLAVDVGAVARANGFPETALDAALAAAASLIEDGLCTVEGRRLAMRTDARRLVRAAAALFDAGLSEAGARHARAV